MAGAHGGPHFYRRVKMGKNKDYIVYKCIKPGCPHYVPRELAVGRPSLCWSCNKEFIMTSKNLQQAKPTCGCRSFRQERLAGMDVNALLKGVK